jgi:hypothetical protein
VNGATIALIAAGVLLSSCSSRPREFTARLAALPADQAKYDTDYERCRTLVASGKRSNFAGGRGASAAAGAAGAAAGVGLGAAALGGTYATYGAAAAAAGATLVLAPVVGIAAAVGMAKHKRAKKEREIKTAMALCLSESGYEVASWAKAKRRANKAADEKQADAPPVR